MRELSHPYSRLLDNCFPDIFRRRTRASSSICYVSYVFFYTIVFRLKSDVKYVNTNSHRFSQIQRQNYTISVILQLFSLTLHLKTHKNMSQNTQNRQNKVQAKRLYNRVVAGKQPVGVLSTTAIRVLQVLGVL